MIRARNFLPPLAALFAAFLIGAPQAGAQTARVCVEEVDGVCLKYRAVAQASPAEADERRLGLGPAQRRSVQRGLAAAGFYRGGIDGALGPRSRRAIADWQRSRGEAATGYLTAAQYDDLALAAPVAAPSESSGSGSGSGSGAAAGGEWTADLRMESSVHCRDLRLRSFKVSGGSMTMVIFHPLDGASRFSSSIGSDGKVSAKAQSNFCSSRLDGAFAGGTAKGTVGFECTETACRGEWSAAAR